MKNLIQRILFGTQPAGEPVNLNLGKPRVQSTCEPAEKASFNEVFSNVYHELKKIDSQRLGLETRE